MKKLLLLSAIVLAGCAEQPFPTSTAAPYSPSPPIPYVKPPWLVDLEKENAEQEEQFKFQRAYIQCQEYDFKLKGCDVLQQKRDTDKRAELVSAKQREEARKKTAQEVVLDEVKELGK